MLSDELKVSVRIGAELFYHSYRVKQYLGRIGPGGSDEHRRLIEGLLRVLERFERDAVNGFAALSNGRPEEESWQQAVEYLHLGLRNLSRCFITIHELLAYLPRESISPEVVFAQKSCFPDFFRKVKPCVVLGCVVNAFEFDFIEILKEKLPEIADIDIFEDKEHIRVLQLAICDADSSLACAVLAHEIGHAIDSENKTSLEVVNEFAGHLGAELADDPDFLETLRSWCGEICADLIASRSIGPAPILSLLSMEYCIHPEYSIYMHSDTHPSTRTRLQIVKEDLAEESSDRVLLHSEALLYDVAWHENIQQSPSDFGTPTEAQELHDNLTELFILPMAKRVCDKLRKLHFSSPSIDGDSLKRCLNRLRLGSPVSAQGEDPVILSEKLRKYSDEDKQQTFASEDARRDWEDERRRSFKILCDEFVEHPLEVPKILMAGYSHRSEIINELYLEAKRPLASSEAVEELCKSLAGLDRLIGNSIVTTGVHKDVCDRLEAHRKRSGE